VHRSYINENRHFFLPHNERLEFLGDAALELIVTEYLFKKYPKAPEGDMTNWRSSLVNTKKLALIARKLEFEKFLYLSKGEAKDTGKAREYILGNAFEAVTGAIYLDQGYAGVHKFIEENLLIDLDYILQHNLHIDPKSSFQEIAQEKAKITPVYEVLKECGPDHNRKFVIGLFLGKKLIAQGQGSSKQEAETRAAEKGLKKWKTNSK